MAGQGAKKRVEENKKRLAMLRLFLAVGLGLHLVLRLGLRQGYKSTWQLVGLGVTALVEALCYSMIAK